MPAYLRTKKENDLWQCAFMILRDECPPEREHYLCMKGEDDSPDCAQCWGDYLWGVGAGTIELPREERRATK